MGAVQARPLSRKHHHPVFTNFDCEKGCNSAFQLELPLESELEASLHAGERPLHILPLLWHIVRDILHVVRHTKKRQIYISSPSVALTTSFYRGEERKWGGQFLDHNEP